MRKAAAATGCLSRLVLVLAACAALAAHQAAAQGKPAELRVALVIGNAAYPTAALRNPVNDATAIAGRLRALGFDVNLRTNVSQREMTRAVSQFGQSLKPGSVALFYYAGHGMQVRGRNFLIPVDAEIESEASARSEAVDLDLVLEQLGPARLSLVILDACRNNPFEGKFRSARGSGLAQIDAPKGTLLAYATAPGKVASDGEGANGLYTAELLKAMEMPGIKVEEVFKIVRVNVIKATASEQVPWESSSLTGDYYFRPVDRAAQEAKVARDVSAKQAELQTRLDAERRQREQDARMLKAEMEKLRDEVRRLSASSAAAAAPAKPVVVAKAEPASRNDTAWPPAPGTKPSTQPPASKAAGDSKQSTASQGSKTTVPEGPAKAAPVGPQRVATAPATAPPTAERSRAEWARRIAALEGQRGKLTYPKAVAILLEPFTDEQLLVLVEKERAIRDMPYRSALAIGIKQGGTLAAWRVWSERSPGFAQETAIEKCGKVARAACSVVMLDGAFREDAFLEWARNAQGESIVKLRNGFLGMITRPP